MNYKHLGIYGYERNTTPYLNKLKGNKNFIYKKAYSSSVSTASSLPFLFNIIREPGNFKLLANKNNNLLKLAKNNGYHTYFFTSQESKVLNDLGVNFINEIKTKENAPMDFINKKDEQLFVYLNEALNDDLYDNKFISIFQRNLHSPYESNYENHKEFNVYDIKQKTRREKATNSYDNAVLFEDFFINKVIEYINSIKDKSIILIITADHGQMLGEDNIYGHNVLNSKVAEVPLIIYFNDNYKKSFNNIPNYISHYEISKLIANIIGYDVENLNENGEFFIQGNDVYSDNFIIPYKRNQNNEPEFQKINSTYKYFE